jgi:hypothetical protein
MFDNTDNGYFLMRDVPNSSKRARSTSTLYTKPKRSFKDWVKAQLNRYNLWIFIFAIILALTGSSIGVTGFYLLLRNDIDKAQNELFTVGKTQTLYLDLAITNCIRAVDAIKGLYGINNASVDYYTGLVPFLQMSNFKFTLLTYFS